MAATADRIEQVLVEDEIQSSFIDYAMSVIVSRALPDVRDGLKPVHRRILFSMMEGNLTPDRPRRKSARALPNIWAERPAMWPMIWKSRPTGRIGIASLALPGKSAR